MITFKMTENDFIKLVGAMQAVGEQVSFDIEAGNGKSLTVLMGTVPAGKSLLPKGEWRIASERIPGNFYVVKRWWDPVTLETSWSCECKDWKYRHITHGECKHIRTVKMRHGVR